MATGGSWLLWVASDGSLWLLVVLVALGGGGSCWLALGRSWWLLGSWLLLVAHGGSWRFLVASGRFWWPLVAPGGFWWLWIVPGGSWSLLLAPGGLAAVPRRFACVCAAMTANERIPQNAWAVHCAIGYHVDVRGASTG